MSAATKQAESVSAVAKAAWVVSAAVVQAETAQAEQAESTMTALAKKLEASSTVVEEPDAAEKAGARQDRGGRG